MTLYQFESVGGTADPQNSRVTLDFDSRAKLQRILASRMPVPPGSLEDLLKRDRPAALGLLAGTSTLFAIQFRMTLPGIESGKFFVVGIQDVEAGIVHTLRRQAGFLSAHHEITQTICADYLESDVLYAVLKGLSGPGLRLVYGVPDDSTSPNPRIPQGQEKPFTPTEFQFQIANVN